MTSPRDSQYITYVAVYYIPVSSYIILRHRYSIFIFLLLDSLSSFLLRLVGYQHVGCLTLVQITARINVSTSTKCDQTHMWAKPYPKMDLFLAEISHTQSTHIIDKFCCLCKIKQQVASRGVKMFTSLTT